MNKLIEKYILLFKRELFHQKMKWKDVEIITEPFNKDLMPESYKYHKEKELLIMKNRINLGKEIEDKYNIKISDIRYSTINELRDKLYQLINKIG
jgi:hypothetical protein